MSPAENVLEKKQRYETYQRCDYRSNNPSAGNPSNETPTNTSAAFEQANTDYYSDNCLRTGNGKPPIIAIIKIIG
jgi:hypothetical protein